MNLRAIYGDKVADDLLKRPIHEADDGNHYFKLIVRGEARRCCIVGAANMVAARKYGHDIPNFVDTPGYWKATTDAQWALGRQLGWEEEAALRDAIDDYDRHDHEFPLIGETVKDLLAKETNHPEP